MTIPATINIFCVSGTLSSTKLDNTGTLDTTFSIVLFTPSKVCLTPSKLGFGVITYHTTPIIRHITIMYTMVELDELKCSLDELPKCSFFPIGCLF